MSRFQFQPQNVCEREKKARETINNGLMIAAQKRLFLRHNKTFPTKLVRHSVSESHTGGRDGERINFLGDRGEICFSW